MYSSETDSLAASKDSAFFSQLFSVLSENTSDLIVAVNSQFRILTCNSQFTEQTGGVAHEGADIRTVLGRESINGDRIEAHLRHSFTGQSTELSVKFTTKSRPQRVWHIKIKPVRMAGPKLGEFSFASLLVIRDSTSSMVADQARAHVESQIDGSPVAVVEWDADGRVIRWSKRAEAVFGWTPSEVLGKTPAEWPFVHPEDIKNCLYALHTAACSLAPQGVCQVRNLTRDGRVLHCEWYQTVFRDSNGDALSTMSLALDVTERETARIELERNQRRLMQIFNSMPQFVWVTEANGPDTLYNDKWYEYTGVPRNFKGSDWLECVHPDDREEVAEEWTRCRDSIEAFEYEYRIRKNDGTYRWHLSRALPLVEADGSVVEWFGSTTDIHDQMMTQTALERSRAELQNALREAQSANEMKTNFLANMSHEIRTPLGAVLGFTDLLKEDSLCEEERKNYLSIIERNGHQLHGIINDILDLSKVESGHLRIEQIECDLETMINDTVGAFSAKAREKGISLAIETSEKLPRVISDPTRIKQVLLNIVGNAVKFTHHGEVKITIESVGEPALTSHSESLCSFDIHVKDSGIGLSDEQRSRIFRPFSQADESVTRMYGGTGLGLALSKKLAQALGGDLLLTDSTPGVGSRFTIQLRNLRSPKVPLSQAPIALAESYSELHSTHPLKIAPTALEGMRVLLVDDSSDNQNLIARLLNKKGAQVETANNGVEAVEKALNGNHDIILMDIQMPLLDGYSATHQLRTKGYEKPVIALTAHAMTETRIKCLSVGCNDHLPKPVNSTDLYRKLLEFTGRSVPLV